MILKHYRLSGLALALVIAALLAPSASARPIDEVSPSTEPAQAPSAATAQPEVLPNADNQQPAGASPNAVLNAAQQRWQVTVDPVPPSALPHGVGYSSYDVGKRYAPPSDVPAAPVTSNPGFDWGDAAIGAGAAFALTMIGLGGILVLSNRRHREEHPVRAV
jgi:hypothetical protein